MLIAFNSEDEDKDAQSVFGCYVGSTVDVHCFGVDSSRSASSLQNLLAHAQSNKEFQKLI